MMITKINIIEHTFLVHATPSIFRPANRCAHTPSLNARGPLIGVGSCATGEAPWSPKGQLAAILAADVASYSRLIEADEEGTLSRLKALRAEIIDPKIAVHKGRMVKTTGDGLLVEFASVVDALRCAAAMQAALANSNGPLPPENRIELRMASIWATSSSRTATSLATASTSPPALKAWPSSAAFACRRVQEDATGKLELAFEDIGEPELNFICEEAV